MSFRSFVRRTTSHILEHSVPNARGAVAVACGSACIDLFHADLHAVRKGRSPMGAPADYDQPRVADVVPSQPYRHDRWRYCGVQGFRSGQPTGFIFYKRATTSHSSLRYTQTTSSNDQFSYAVSKPARRPLLLCQIQGFAMSWTFASLTALIELQSCPDFSKGSNFAVLYPYKISIGKYFPLLTVSGLCLSKQ